MSRKATMFFAHLLSSSILPLLISQFGACFLKKSTTLNDIINNNTEIPMKTSVGITLLQMNYGINNIPVQNNYLTDSLDNIIDLDKVYFGILIVS